MATKPENKPEYKPLIIDVDENYVPNGGVNVWSTLGNTTQFIQRILTPSLAKGTNIGQLVSGIPTAFARVDLFNKAIRYVSNAGTDNAGPQNIVAYYQQLVDEWQGFIACIALDYANIRVSKVDLAYTDRKDLKSTENIYEMKGAFGNMLLKKALLWCEQNLAENETAIPFINIVKYRGTVVGATSPDTLLFTSTGYKLEDENGEKPWVDKKTGKFTNPLKSKMNSEQTITLYAYLDYLVNGLNDYDKYYSNLPSALKIKTIGAIQTLLNRWKQEIAAYASANGYSVQQGSVPPVSVGFTGAFKKLFSYKDVLFGLEGVIYDEEVVDGSVEFDPKNLLLDESALIAPINIAIKEEDKENLPILVMTAEHKNNRSQKEYFALPLSALGLNVFGRNTAALVGMMSANAIKSSLKATYDPSLKSGNLEVVLTLVTQTDKPRSFRKVYSVGQMVANKDILIWPNFATPQWNAYYMYNELPHNGTTNEYKAYPFVGDRDEKFRIKVDKDGKPILLSSKGEITPEMVNDAELLVCNSENVADNNYKYEIYQSVNPFKGVRLESPTKAEGGYLLINYSNSKGENKLPKDRMNPNLARTLEKACVGIDFGSTNTSIAYSTGGVAQGFSFTNQRVSLFGNELSTENVFVKENHIFFFQGFGSAEGVPSNSIKSVLTLHDSRRLKLKVGETRALRDSKPVIGGFPCFVENLPLIKSDDKNIYLKFPTVGEVTQVHNMKWEDNETSKANKKAFLNTLMLQVYAILFEKGLYPAKLKWSYPSSMRGNLLGAYNDIWADLVNLKPVLNEQGEPYSLKVSNAQIRIDGATPSGGFGSGTSTGGFGAQSGGFGSGTSTGGFGAQGGGFGSGISTGGFGAQGGGFGASAGGFGGGISTQQMGAQQEDLSEFMPDALDQEISYNPVPSHNAQTFASLSEAESVANYNASNETNVGTLTLCFDVGGSTTDISALFQLNNETTMIKQNSIRFAAQRVSNVAGLDDSFKDVLLDICQTNNIMMLGLNMGGDSYSEQTAPYFFNQIVNRLSIEQLPSFYARINSRCPKLMCINLYVTGLLMYYGGQIARKLVADVTKSNEWPKAISNGKPKVKIAFAGKGSCLYQWLLQQNAQACYHYYSLAFRYGYGEQGYFDTLAGHVEIEFPALGTQNSNLKYEVSKGLANGDSRLYKPSTERAGEIIGENGFVLVGGDNECREVDFTNSITSKMVQYIGQRFVSRENKADKFTEFCGFFYNVYNQLYGWKIDVNELVNACKEMNITRYIQNMPEFRESSRNPQEFSFVAPIIILEGMKFYDETLMNILKRK